MYAYVLRNTAKILRFCNRYISVQHITFNYLCFILYVYTHGEQILTLFYNKSTVI
jgi:hypothetical protein